MRPTTKSRTRRGRVGPLGIFLLGAALFAEPTGSSIVTCGSSQKVQIADGRPWRCQVDLLANRAYLAQIPRQTRNMALEILAPDARRVLKVDSPTVRAGPELLFFSPRVAGRYTLVIAAVDRGLPTRTIDIEWRELSGVTSGSTLARGLTGLTSAAAVADASRTDDGERRLTILQSARNNLQAAHADAFEAEALLRIASTYFWTLGDWTRAAESAALAAEAFGRVPDPIMSSQAKTLRAESLIEGAAPSQAAARPAPKSGHTQFGEAEQILTDCSRRFAAAGFRYDEAAVINYLGVSAHYQGRLTEARAHYQTAVRMFSEIGESASEVQSLQNIAVIDFQRGDYGDAVKAYKGLLGKLDPESNRRTYLAILINLAVAQYALGRTDEALESLLTALPLTEDSAGLADRARTWYQLGRLYLTLGDERGEVFLQQALELRQSKAVQDRQGLLTSLVINGDVSREKGATQQALKLHTQALNQAVSPLEKARVLLAVGQDQMAAGSTGAALETYQRALKLELPEQARTRLMLTGAYGYARSRQGDAAGRELLLKAAQASEASGDDDYAAEYHTLLASEERRTGQVDSALRHVGKALSLYNAQRIRAVNPDLRATYISNRASAYELQADLNMTLWQRTSSPTEKDRLASAALGTGELLRTRALADFRQFAQQGSSEADASDSAVLRDLDSRLAAKRHRLAAVLDLDNPPADQVATLRREIALLRTQLDVAAAQKKSSAITEMIHASSALSLSQLQRSLGGNSTLVTWLLGEERSWIWCITRDAATAYPLARGNDVESAAQDLHALWSVPSAGAPARDRELKASRTILGPAGALVSKYSAVTIVADGALRSIPFGAVWVESGGTTEVRRLAEIATVSYQPALNRWQRAAARSDKTPVDRRILLVGDPVVIGDRQASNEIAELRGEPRNAGVPQIQRLPASSREVNSIVKIASGWHADVLLGEAATKAAVLAMPLGTFRVLHFATHARLDVHDPQLSSIVLSGRPDEVGQNVAALSLRDILGLGLKADAVVLSACEGSLGKEYRGQLSFGLSEAFLLAGATNVLGSLWKVSDVATEKYMRSFYDHYMKGGLTSTAAAQAVSREMMRDPTFGQPYYWAAFVVLAS